jgi:hypothetical protein
MPSDPIGPTLIGNDAAAGKAAVFYCFNLVVARISF